MAIINLDEITDNVRPYLKKDTYTARIINAEFTTSKAGAPMIVVQWEIVAPEAIEDNGGKLIRIAGLQFRDYLSFSEKAAEITMRRIKGLHKALELPPEFDDEDPNVDQYAGLAADVTIETEQQAQKTEDGSPVLGGDGEPVMNNNYRLKRVLRLSEEHTLAAGGY
tara:strand:+ start:597 stop:1094 length:498 start_codon:yes stop_codon:yes gene_type:complete